MPDELYSAALETIRKRNVWEQRQRLWYTMRHHGVKRRNLPYPGANDLHWNLIDSQIGKAKPFYFAQAFSNEKLAQFLSLAPEMQTAEESAADWFDYQIKQKTEFETELLSTIDNMLLFGRGILKAFYDPFKKRLEYRTIEPMFMIVPDTANDLPDADFFVEVQQLSVQAYKRDSRYNQDEEVIRLITGGQGNETTAYKDEILRREGITYSGNKGLIVLWNQWTLTTDGWEVSTYSPTNPDLEIRKKFKCIYKFQGERICPFISFPAEVKDKGWYSPRGLSERIAPQETYLTKLWNSRADYLDFVSKPLFKGDGQINSISMEFKPGSVLAGIEPVQMPQVPFNVKEEMEVTMNIAQDSIASPDASIPNQKDTSNSPTATQVNYQAQLAGSQIDMNGRVFRKRLAQTYVVSWAIMLEHQLQDEAYYAAGSTQKLPEQAKHDAYLIAPDGSADLWNRGAKVQKAVSNWQLFANNPIVDQEYLAKEVFRAQDSRTADRAVIPQTQKKAAEAQQEALNCLLLMEGYPVQAMPYEDHQTRLQVLFGKLQQLQARGVPPNPMAIQRFQQLIAQRVTLLQQSNPAVAKQIMQAVEQIDPQAGQAENAAPGITAPGQSTSQTTQIAPPPPAV